MKAEKRDSLIIYRSFYEAIKDLPKENQAEVWTAIFEYGLNFNEPELSGISKTIFTLIKPQLTANIAKYHNGKKAKVKQKESKPEAKGKQVKSKTEGNVNDNVNDNVNGNNNEIYYFKIGKDSYKQKPSELWNTIYRGQLEAICMNQLRGVDVHLLLSTFDTDSATKEFDDYNHFMNTLVKIGKKLIEQTPVKSNSPPVDPDSAWERAKHSTW